MTDRRSLSQRARAELFLAQNGKCHDCPRKLQSGMYHADHRQPLADDGTNDADNIVLICLDCHKAKTRIENKSRAHHKRLAVGGKTRKGRPFPGSREDTLMKHVDGTVTRR